MRACSGPSQDVAWRFTRRDGYWATGKPGVQTVNVGQLGIEPAGQAGPDVQGAARGHRRIGDRQVARPLLPGRLVHRGRRAFASTVAAAVPSEGYGNLLCGIADYRLLTK